MATISEQITNYWAKYYVNPTVQLCSLCGNRGIIDTRGRARSAAGVEAGKLNWCVCPNGQAYRKHHKPDAPSAETP